MKIKMKSIDSFDTINLESLEEYAKKVLEESINYYEQKLQNAKESGDRGSVEYYSRSLEGTQNAVELVLGREHLDKDFELIKNFVESQMRQGRDVRIIVARDIYETSNESEVEYIFSKEQMEKLGTLDAMSQNGKTVEVRFDEFNGENLFEKCWTYDQVLHANQVIDLVVDHIKKNNFSPYEAAMYIHRFITNNFKYKEGDCSDRGREKQATIIGALTDKTIVCAGYASMTKAIIDRLGYPGLSCRMYGCKLYSRNGNFESGHCQCMITIDDNKYDVHGNYINDACWDSKEEDGGYGLGFGHFMFPIGDLVKLKDYKISQKFESSRGSSIIMGEEERIILGKLEDAQDQIIRMILSECKNADGSKNGKNKRMLIKKCSKINAKLKKEEMLKMKYNPTYPVEIVELFGGKSEPIPLSVTESAMRAVWLKIKNGDDAQYVEEKLKQIMLDSAAEALSTFKPDAENSFVKMALKQKTRAKRRTRNLGNVGQVKS